MQPKKSPVFPAHFSAFVHISFSLSRPQENGQGRNHCYYALIFSSPRMSSHHAICYNGEDVVIACRRFQAEGARLHAHVRLLSLQGVRALADNRMERVDKYFWGHLEGSA